jgi:diguanylate cyclase (GGDEF)-like protein/PAS domain S-box-containing protein
MNFLDIRTLTFLAMFSSILLALGLQLVNRHIANEPSLKFWSWGTTATGVTYVLLALRGVLPDWLSIVAANIVLIAGVNWLYLGNRAFLGLRRQWPWYWWLAGAVGLAIASFTYIWPSLNARIVINSLASACVLLPAGWVMLRAKDDRNRGVRWFVAGAYLILAFFMLVRAAATPSSVMGQDLLALSNPVQTLALVFGLGLNIVLGIGLPLLVAERMQRKLAGSELRLNSILDNTSVGISFVQDGRLVWANKAMAELFGYSVAEMVNQRTSSFYVSQEAYEKLKAQSRVVFAEGGRYTTEMEMLHRDGRRIWMHMTGQPATLDAGTQGRIWVFTDITERKQIESQLHDLLATNNAILRNSPVAIGVYRRDGQCILANQAYADMVGASAHQLLAQNFHAIKAWHTLGLLEDCEATLADGTQRQREGHVTTSFGREIWLEAAISATVLYGERHLLVQFLDRTQQQRDKQALLASEQRLAMALAATSLSTWDIDLVTDVIHLDPQWSVIMGGPPGETVTTGSEIIRMTHPDDVQQAVKASLEAMKGLSDDFRSESRLRAASGDWKWIQCSGKVVARDDEGRALRAIGTNLDVTERRTAEELIRQLAYYDTLTGLPNRRLMLDRLHQAWEQSKRFRRAMAVMFLDLDGFKAINDTLGHDVGDELLKTVAGRLTLCVRAGDTVARQGGDEFVVVLAEINNAADASAVATKILDALALPVTIAGRNLQVTTSVGVSVFAGDGLDDPGELMRKADAAMYMAKKAGRNTYRYYQAENAEAAAG